MSGKTQNVDPLERKVGVVGQFWWFLTICATHGENVLLQLAACRCGKLFPTKKVLLTTPLPLTHVELLAK